MEGRGQAMSGFSWGDDVEETYDLGELQSLISLVCFMGLI